MTSSSTPTPFLDSVKENLEGASGESDYLSFDAPTDHALEGISFLFKTFSYSLQTFQYVKTDPVTQATQSPAKTYDDPNAAYRDALQYNKKGFDVFFMVNEGDGVIHPGKRICRSAASVTELSKCFIDTDKCPRDKIDTYLKSIDLHPHVIIESSKDRFHYYFFFEPIKKTQKWIDQWKQVQHMLHRLGDATIKNPSKTLGTDSTMHDYSKVLRVPGFVHVSKLSTVQLVEHSTHPIYDFEELYEKTNAASFTEDSVTVDTNPETPIEEGDRYHTLQALSMKLANSNADRDDAFKQYTFFIQTKLVHTDSEYIFPDKSLTPKSLDIFNSAFKKIKREHEHTLKSLTESLEASEVKKSSWELPDSFYLNAPNGFGHIVKQVMDNSIYPCASLAFGTFLAGLSILKAKYFLTPHGSTPALYILNVAPTGYGKAAPMGLLQNTLVHLGYGKLIENKMRSDRGVYAHLAVNEGSGFFILDEISQLFKNIQDKKASAHNANITEALLSLYSSSAMKGISFGKLSGSNTKKGEKAIVVDNPTIAICGYTVPSEFYSMFNEESVLKGLFQRFIPVVAEVRYIEKNSSADNRAIIESELFTSILARSAPGIQSRQITESNDVTGYPSPSHSESSGDSAVSDAHGSSEDSVSSPLENIERVKIPYSPEALVRFNSLETEYRQKLIETARDPELMHTSGLYSRLSEQIERVATVLATDEINLETLEYAITFIESRHKAIMESSGAILGGKGANRELQTGRVLHALSMLCIEQDSTVVYKTDVFRRVQRHFGSVKEFNQLIEGMEEMGDIQRVDGYKPAHKNARAGTGLKLKEV